MTNITASPIPTPKTLSFKEILENEGFYAPVGKWGALLYVTNRREILAFLLDSNCQVSIPSTGHYWGDKQFLRFKGTVTIQAS